MQNCSCVASLFLNDKLLTFYKNDHQKSELANKDDSSAKKQKVKMLEVRCESNISGLIGGPVAPGDEWGDCRHSRDWNVQRRDLVKRT